MGVVALVCHGRGYYYGMLNILHLLKVVVVRGGVGVVAQVHVVLGFSVWMELPELAMGDWRSCRRLKAALRLTLRFKFRM